MVVLLVGDEDLDVTAHQERAVWARGHAGPRPVPVTGPRSPAGGVPVPARAHAHVPVVVHGHQ